MKINTIVIAIVIIILLVGGWWLWQRNQPGAGNSGNATQVIHFTPKLSGGQQQSGDCFSNSIAALPRTDAWRCTVGDTIYDPCFSVSQMDAVVCGADPLSGNDGFQLLLKKPLPGPAAAPAQIAAWGWVIELGDKTVCAPLTGTRAQVNGKTTTYGCKPPQGNANVVILGDFDSSKPLWTAQVATISFDNNQIQTKKIETLSVTKAWQ